MNAVKTGWEAFYVDSVRSRRYARYAVYVAFEDSAELRKYVAAGI